MGILTGMWDESSKTLTIFRPNGQKKKIKNSNIIKGSTKVFGVQTVGNEIHVLKGPVNNRQPNQRIKFNDAGVYKGTSGI